MSVLTLEQTMQSDPQGATQCAVTSLPPERLDGPQAHFAMLAHDLKNPLAVSRGRAQLMQRRIRLCDLLDRPQIREELVQIESATARMTALLDQLIDVQVLSERVDDPDIHVTYLTTMARALVSDFQHTSDRHRFRVHVPARELVGHWQPVHLERILSNLISNAVKYSPRGGEIAVTVWEEVDPHDGTDWAFVRVTDNGIGIPADEQRHLFELRHRAANARATGAGTGMGLATVRQLVEKYKGAVSVESVEGRGSSFTVRLPLEPVAADSPLGSQPEADECSYPELDRGERDVLIRLLQRGVREARKQVSVCDTDQMKALIKAREALLRGLLKRALPPTDLVETCQTE